MMIFIHSFQNCLTKLNLIKFLTLYYRRHSVASQNYNLRRRPHTLTLLAHNTSLSDCNFYPRDAMLARVIGIATYLSVCLSVRHKPVLCQNDFFTIW